MNSNPLDTSSQRPRDLLILWWSATGAAQQLAEGAARGALTEPATLARLVRCDQADLQDLIRADALLFVCPEMLGSMAGKMKDFFDRCYYPALERLAGKPYALIVTAGSDGQGAVKQLQRIATGWRLREVAAPLIVCTHAQTAAAIAAPKNVSAQELGRAGEIGATLAVGLAAGVW